MYGLLPGARRRGLAEQIRPLIPFPSALAPPSLPQRRSRARSQDRERSSISKSRPVLARPLQSVALRSSEITSGPRLEWLE